MLTVATVKMKILFWLLQLFPC